MNYIKEANSEIKKYFYILEPDFPEWLNEYINTEKLLLQRHISITCGTIYSDLFESEFFFSSLDHAIAVALIIWHFTHDKKQTLSGLFHDISTPVFKHCIDFLHSDYMKQESTEDLTTNIIKSSKDIMKLLKRDKIKVSEVDDYHKYTIADNDTPKLSADRLEYSLSNALFTYKLLDFNKIKEIYNDIEIQINEAKEKELGFKTQKNAKTFVEITSQLSIIYREDRTRYSMQLIADILKKLKEENTITIEDLYKLKEKEIIDIIENSKYKEIFNKWRKAKKVKTSKEEPKNVYYVRHGAKVRYINPLIKGKRSTETCEICKQLIEKNLLYDMDKYVYLDFNI